MKIYWYHGHKNIVGKRVRMARKHLRLTQGELAAKLQLESIEMEQKSISRLELGDRFVSDYELLMLSQILQVSVAWLLTGEGEENSRLETGRQQECISASHDPADVIAT